MAFSSCCCYCCFPCVSEPSGEGMQNRHFLLTQRSLSKEQLPAKAENNLQPNPNQLSTTSIATMQPQVLCNKEKALNFKRVNVPDIDTLFADIAKAFSKQQDDCVATRKAIQSLKETYDCLPANSLSICMEKMKQEHDACGVQVHMEGYRFWLTVREDEVPEKLNLAEQQVRELDRATKGVISTKTKLQEMISSVLQSQDKMVEKVKVANSEYLDFIRLEGNLRQNLEKISLIKQLSKQYVEEANNVLREISKTVSLSL